MTVQPGTDLVPITQHPTPYVLDHSDRCDQCGARAYVHTILDGGSLYWCRHHWLKHQPILQPKALYINDETRALFEHIRDDGHWVEGKEAHLPPRKKQPWEKP